MNQNVEMFRNVMKSMCSDTYIDMWEEYPNIDFGIALENVMNSSVHNTELCSLALRLLNTTKEVTWIKSYHWTSKLLKLYESCNEIRLAHQIITAFGILAKLANESRESRRLFGTHHITNIINVISKEHAIPIDKLIVLQCISIILELYPEYCIHAEGAVRTFLSNLVDSQKYNIVEHSAKCYHLLLNVSKYRARNTQVKDLWRIYQAKLTEDLQTLLDNFMGASHSAVISAVECGPLSIPVLILSDDPIIRLPRIFIRWRNFAVYLIVTLREPLSTEKLINPKKILYFIKNALEALSTGLENKTIHHIVLTLLLPQLHYILLQILEALITTLGSDLRGSYKEVWHLLGNMLNISPAIKSMEEKQSYMRLRVKLCNVISLWCKITGQGSRGDLVHSFIINALVDISSIYSITKSGFRRNIADKTIQEVISATHSCLFEILSSSPNCLKSQVAKTIEATTLNIYTQMRDVRVCNKIKKDYIHDLMQVLFAMLTTRNFLSPFCAEALINISSETCLTDHNSQTRYRNALGLLYLENYIHPQKDNLKRQIEVRSMRNVFLESFDRNRKLPKPICFCDGRNTKYSDEAALGVKKVTNMRSEADDRNLPPAIDIGDLTTISESSLSNSNSGNNYPKHANQSNSYDEQLIEKILTTFVDDLS